MKFSKLPKWPKLRRKIAKSRIFLFLSSNVLYFLYFLYRMTLSIRVSGKGHMKEALDAKKPIVLALWHEHLFLAPELLKIFPSLSFKVLISKSQDGDIPSAFAEKFKNLQVIRVGHNIRHYALNEMVESLEHGDIVGITPDGPRGPRHKIKPGIFFAAKKVNANIVCVQWNSMRMWKLTSWDQFKIPKPFSHVTINISKSLSVDAISSLEELELILNDVL